MEPGLATELPACAEGSLSLEAFSDARASVELHDDWQLLQGRATEDNIFLTWEWQHAWWAELGQNLSLDLCAFYDRGRLVAVTPAYRKEEQSRTLLRFGGGLEVTDYLGFLVEAEYREATGCAFLRHCLELPGLVLDFHFLREDGVTLQAIQVAAKSLGLRQHLQPEEVSPRILLDCDWETYLQTLDKKARHELRRKRRRMEEAGGWQIRESEPATLAEDLESFFALHSRSSHAKADFLDEDKKNFFRHICGDLMQAGWLSLRFLRFRDRDAAAVMGFVYRDKLLAYNSGYEPELRALSPGLVLMSEEVRLAAEARLKEVDFLRGSEKYKYDLGAHDVPLLHLMLEAP